mgnify:CR=1 FL=1
MFLRQGAKGLKTEQGVVLSQDQAARLLQGLSGELKDRPAAFLLPGANDKGATLVALSGTGWPVLAEGYGSSQVEVLADQPDLQVGTPLALVASTGQVFYLPALASLTRTDASRGVWTLEFGGCLNPLRWTPNMRAYRAEALALVSTPTGLELRGTSLQSQEVLTLQGLTLRYVYLSPSGSETLSTTYEGAALPDGSRFTALAFQSVGTGTPARALTARLPLNASSVEVRDVRTCGGGGPPPPGTGIVTVVVDPAPPGGGNVTLTASSYTRSFRTTSTFRDVPEGPVEVTAQLLWTDSLTAWAPSPAAQAGTVYSFAPLTFLVRYAVVPGTLYFSTSGLPPDGTVRLSAGPYSATLSGSGTRSISATPGTYPTSADPEASVGRSQGSASWTEVYTLQSLSPAQVAVRSYDSAYVTASYTGPLPGTLCYDADCQEATPGYYTAPGESVVGTWSNTYSQACPAGYTGSVTVTERWRTVRYWTPSAGGLSSRGTLRFTSATRDEMVDRQTADNCTPVATDGGEESRTNSDGDSTTPTDPGDGDGGGGGGGGYPPPELSPI